MSDIVADTEENPNRERKYVNETKDMSIRRWLNHIHDPVKRKEALAAAKEAGTLDNKEEWLSEAVNQGFEYDKTPSGVEFWSDYAQRQDYREDGYTDEEIEDMMNPQIPEETEEKRRDKFADQDPNVENRRKYTSLPGKTVSEWIQGWRPDGLYETFEGFHERMQLHLRHIDADKLEHDFEQALTKAFPFTFTKEGERYWVNFHAKYKSKVLEEWDKYRIKPMEADKPAEEPFEVEEPIEVEEGEAKVSVSES